MVVRRTTTGARRPGVATVHAGEPEVSVGYFNRGAGDRDHGGDLRAITDGIIFGTVVAPGYSAGS